jgi:hypothetical protein
MESFQFEGVSEFHKKILKPAATRMVSPNSSGAGTSRVAPTLKMIFPLGGDRRPSSIMCAFRASARGRTTPTQVFSSPRSMSSAIVKADVNVRVGWFEVDGGVGASLASYRRLHLHARTS